MINKNLVSSDKKAKSLIELKNVSKTYQMGEVEVKALDDVSLSVTKGDFIAIIGSSGSGKSTMMNLIGCLDKPTKGKLFVNSENLAELSESSISVLRGKTIGFIFQQYNLIQNITAYDNVLLPLELQEVDETYARKRARQVLTQVGLGDKMNHLPSQLSGGQQQRVSIARCLVTNPEIILADEPTGALDSKTGSEVLNTLVNLWKKDGKTIVMITHDLELSEYANTVIRLKDGKIIDIRSKNKI